MNQDKSVSSARSWQCNTCLHFRKWQTKIKITLLQLCVNPRSEAVPNNCLVSAAVTAQSYMKRSLDSTIMVTIEIHCFSYQKNNLWVGHHGHHTCQHNHLHTRDKFPAFGRFLFCLSPCFGSCEYGYQMLQAIKVFQQKRSISRESFSPVYTDDGIQRLLQFLCKDQERNLSRELLLTQQKHFPTLLSSVQLAMFSFMSSPQTLLQELIAKSLKLRHICLTLVIKLTYSGDRHIEKMLGLKGWLWRCGCIISSAFQGKKSYISQKPTQPKSIFPLNCFSTSLC